MKRLPGTNDQSSISVAWRRWEYPHRLYDPILKNLAAVLSKIIKCESAFNDNPQGDAFGALVISPCVYPQTSCLTLPDFGFCHQDGFRMNSKPIFCLFLTLTKDKIKVFLAAVSHQYGWWSESQHRHLHEHQILGMRGWSILKIFALK